MRLAILADIHGNATALDAVLTDLDRRGGADAIVVAGDLCLDGPKPREVLDRVRALHCSVIQGNTDRDLAAAGAGGAETDWARLLAWTRERIGEEGVAYLRDLPFSRVVEAPLPGAAVLVVHANPRDLDQHLRPLAPDDELRPLLAGVPPSVAVVAFGHLHIPYTRQVGRLLLADISSVGLPKDGDPRAGYGLLTWADGAWHVEQCRVDYPLEAVVTELREAAPPGVEELITTLVRATYPNPSKARGERREKQKGKRAAVPVDPAEPFGPAIHRLIEERFDTLRAETKGVRAGDVEAVHAMRVATRRLRAALDAAAEARGSKQLERIRREVKGLAHALGAVRDRDVQLEQLRTWRAAAPASEGPGLHALVTRLEAEREAHRAVLLEYLDRWQDENMTARVAALVASGWGRAEQQARQAPRSPTERRPAHPQRRARRPARLGPARFISHAASLVLALTGTSIVKQGAGRSRVFAPPLVRGLLGRLRDLARPTDRGLTRYTRPLKAMRGR